MQTPVNRKEMFLIPAQSAKRRRHRRALLEINIGPRGRTVMGEEDQPAKNEHDQKKKSEKKFHRRQGTLAQKAGRAIRTLEFGRGAR